MFDWTNMTFSVNIRICSLFVSLICLAHQVPARHLNACDKGPSDVIFILDSSGSIYRHDFDHQVDFVNDVINEFDVGMDKMRVGAVSFSNWAFLEFNLNTHFTKQDLHSSISGIPHSMGDTNTAAAVTFVKDNMFSVHNGGRYNVPHVIIVMTDGESNDPQATTYAAKAARRMGIQIFAIGIGPKVNEKELRSIASDPPEQFMFRVANYDALQSITETVAIKTCAVTTHRPTTPGPLSTTTELVMDVGCGDSVVADVVMAVSPRGSDAHTEKALEFFRQVAQGLDIADDKVHVGLVPKNCRDIPEINLETFDKKKEALQTLDKLTNQEQADSTDVLKFMRKNSFNSRMGSRHRARKVAIMVVDEAPENMELARKQAQRLQNKKGVEIFIIGVGKQVKPSKLRRLATDPPERHVFHVTNYDDLYSVIPIVQQAICPVPLL